VTEPVGVFLSLKPVESPVHIARTPEIEARKSRLLALWSEHIGEVVDHGEGDVEDSYEEFARLDATVDAFGAENVWVPESRRRGFARNIVTGEEVPDAFLSHLPRYGVQHSGDDHIDENAVERLADRYFHLDAFTRNAGRRVIRSAIWDDGRPGLYEDAHSLRGTAKRVVVKTARTKLGLWTIDLPGETYDETKAAIFDELEWFAVSLGDRADAFIVQEWVPMLFEYRLFVVDGEVVTGAGCIEENTPLDNRGRFDPAVRESRAGVNAVVDRPDLVEQMVDFGRKVAAEVTEESPALNQYVLDVAIDADGQPLVIEMNSLLNSGLYASAPSLVTSAIAARSGSAPHVSKA
jgi:hypothetical protein